jgi:pSer/pThr/pTyr-binding forkhead associated (FHA) protein
MFLVFTTKPRVDEAGEIGLTIGRTLENDLQLRDEKVSRRHAATEVQPGGQTLLRDLGPPNGTYVNGR